LFVIPSGLQAARNYLPIPLYEFWKGHRFSDAATPAQSGDEVLSRPFHHGLFVRWRGGFSPASGEQPSFSFCHSEWSLDREVRDFVVHAFSNSTQKLRALNPEQRAAVRYGKTEFRPDQSTLCHSK
jgi:hypothetical protein